LCQVLLNIYQVEHEFFIDELVVDAGGDEAQQQAELQQQRGLTGFAQMGVGSNTNQQQFSAIMVQLKSMEQQAAEHFQATQQVVTNFRSYATLQFGAISKSVQANALQAPRVAWAKMAESEQNRLHNQAVAAAHRNGEEPPPRPPKGPPARLMDKPKFLAELWHEWEFGHGGNKPAKDFTPSERGKVKSQYSKRNHIWKLMQRLINANYSVEGACDVIYRRYQRNATITDIIKGIQKDAKEYGPLGHPSLRV
jgi:hypothetical protein